MTPMTNPYSTPPQVRIEAREVALWDNVGRAWIRGRSAEFAMPRDVISFVWTNTGANTDVAPDHDTILDVLYAQRISIQLSSKSISNTSDNFDVNIESSQDRIVWDTLPYAQSSIGDDEVRTYLVQPGPRFMRLRGDNNASGTTGYVFALVQITD